MKGLYPTLFPGGRSVTKIPCSVRVSVHAASPSLHLGHSVLTVVPHSCPLGLCPQRCHHSSLCSVLLQSCSPATLSHPEHWVELFFTESIAMYCPQVCSELVNQGQVRILATGTLISSTYGTQEEGVCRRWRMSTVFSDLRETVMLKVKKCPLDRVTWSWP